MTRHTEEEWGPWIDHDGKGWPPFGEYIHAVFQDGCEEFGIPERGKLHGSWRWLDGFIPVIRYRIRKPKGLTILESILADVGTLEPAI